MGVIMKNISFLSKLNRFDFVTIFIFLLGFLFSILDLKMLYVIQSIVETFNNYIFAISYILAFLFLLLTVKGFIKNGSLLRLLIEDNFKQRSIKCLQLFLLGYYMGFVVNISNAFIIVLFNKFIF